MSDAFLNTDPEHLAAFVQEYVRRESQPDAGVLAVIASQLRDPQWLPHQIAERLLAQPEIQAAIRAAKAFYKPPESTEVSADTVKMDMEDVFQQAMGARQFTAAIAAKKLQSEILGIIRRDVTFTVTHKVEEMTTAQLMKIAQRGTQEIDGEYMEIKPGLPG